MKKILMFLGVLTFVTQAHCKQNHELLTVDNDLRHSIPLNELLTVDNNSSESIRLNFHDEKDNQYSSSILKPGDRTILNLSPLNLDPSAAKSQLSYVTITLEDKVKGNHSGNVFNRSFPIKRKVHFGPIRITNAITEYLKLNN